MSGAGQLHDASAALRAADERARASIVDLAAAQGRGSNYVAAIQRRLDEMCALKVSAAASKLLDLASRGKLSTNSARQAEENRAWVKRCIKGYTAKWDAWIDPRFTDEIMSSSLPADPLQARAFLDAVSARHASFLDILNSQLGRTPELDPSQNCAYLQLLALAGARRKLALDVLQHLGGRYDAIASTIRDHLRCYPGRDEVCTLLYPGSTYSEQVLDENGAGYRGVHSRNCADLDELPRIAALHAAKNWVELRKENLHAVMLHLAGVRLIENLGSVSIKGNRFIAARSRSQNRKKIYSGVTVIETPDAILVRNTLIREGIVAVRMPIASLEVVRHELMHGHSGDLESTLAALVANPLNGPLNSEFAGTRIPQASLHQRAAVAQLFGFSPGGEYTDELKTRVLERLRAGTVIGEWPSLKGGEFSLSISGRALHGVLAQLLPLLTREEVLQLETLDVLETAGSAKATQAQVKRFRERLAVRVSSSSVKWLLAIGVGASAAALDAANAHLNQLRVTSSASFEPLPVLTANHPRFTLFPPNGVRKSSTHGGTTIEDIVMALKLAECASQSSSAAATLETVATLCPDVPKLLRQRRTERVHGTDQHAVNRKADSIWRQARGNGQMSHDEAQHLAKKALQDAGELSMTPIVSELLVSSNGSPSPNSPIIAFPEPVATLSGFKLFTIRYMPAGATHSIDLVIGLPPRLLDQPIKLALRPPYDLVAFDVGNAPIATHCVLEMWHIESHGPGKPGSKKRRRFQDDLERALQSESEQRGTSAIAVQRPDYDRPQFQRPAQQRRPRIAKLLADPHIDLRATDDLFIYTRGPFDIRSLLAQDPSERQPPVFFDTTGNVTLRYIGADGRSGEADVRAHWSTFAKKSHLRVKHTRTHAIGWPVIVLRNKRLTLRILAAERDETGQLAPARKFVKTKEHGADWMTSGRRFLKLRPVRRAIKQELTDGSHFAVPF